MKYLLGLVLIITGYAKASSESFSENHYDERGFVKFSQDSDFSTIAKKISSVGLEAARYIPEINVYVVKAENRNDLKEAIEALKSDRDVVYAEPNFEIKINQEPNDERWDDQNWLRTIQAPKAWDLSTGSKSVIVAISDTGISTKHKDLVPQLWINAGEIADNEIDDDGNGYVDDVNGYNFFNNSGKMKDDHGHGSHVAGIVGARGNDAEGVVGVNWNVTLMGVKFLSAKGSGSVEGGVDSVIYAVKNGARIINASWGSTENAKALEDAIRYASDNNVLFVAAAGNSKANNEKGKHFPSNYDFPTLLSVLSITAGNHLGKSDFSNFGITKVHLGAPGSRILSSSSGEGYAYLSGTSMASPVVAGVAALILSVAPNATAIELRNLVMSATMPNKSIEDKSASGGHVDASRAMEIVHTPGVYPLRTSLRIGQSAHFSAWKLGPVSWSVSDSELASINAAGVVTAISPGSFQVVARLANGQVISNEWVRVVGASSGGCEKTEINTKPTEAGVSLFLYLMPLALMSFIRRNKRGSKYD